MRVQRGNIYAASGCWYLRFYDATGKRQSRQVGRLTDFPTKESVQPIAAPILAKVNEARFHSVGRFVPGLDLEHELRTQRMQRGSFFQSSGSWYVRFYNLAGKRESRWLGLVSDYPTRESIEPLAQPILKEAKRHRFAASKLGAFVESIYLPWTSRHLRPSTAKGYRNLWCGLSDRCGSWSLPGVKPVHIQKLLDELAHDRGLSKGTLQHTKHFLSGVFRHAIQQGVLEGINPVTAVRIPRAPGPRETHAYDLAEIDQMVRVLPEPASTLILTFAFTGLRLGELRGMLWENLEPGEPFCYYNVTQSIWCGRVTEPKTKQSKAEIPIIAPLSKRLEVHRQRSGNPTSGPIFRTESGAPMELDKYFHRTIKPALEAAGIKWHGYNAFRRGIASNLFALGCDDLTVQRILRHSKVIVTRKHYIKVRDAKVEKAMHQLSAAAAEVFNAGPEQPAELRPTSASDHLHAR